MIFMASPIMIKESFSSPSLMRFYLFIQHVFINDDDDNSWSCKWWHKSQRA